MRICLVSMPWQLLDVPSLALGILHRRVHDTRPGDDVVEVHAALGWAEFLLAESGGQITPAQYTDVAEHGLHHGLGDWIFAGALHGDPCWREPELHRYAGRHRLDVDGELRMREYAAPFVEHVAEQVLGTDPDVVGFTTTFMQNVPSLAVARRLKQLRPGVAVVFGGANCDGPMGAALHRNHRFVDHVVRGEGELAFPALLDRLAGGRTPADVPGVCWWDGDRSVANPDRAGMLPAAAIPPPDYDGWQAALEASPVRGYLEPKLVLEGARGCWWGEKHQCTFCGLNGSSIGFRGKPAEQLWTELSALVARHKTLDVVMVDNIIDMAYFDRLLPRLAGSGWHLRMHWEVKSNLRPEQLDRLAAAGVVHIQPGIESLSGRVLDLMDKGVSGWRNIRLLRDCEDRGLTVSWNYLYGFPGEGESDYAGVLDQLPALVHLQPPGGATRIALERFSPYFERPELGFPDRVPADLYDHVYDLPAEELADLVYLFDTAPRGIGGQIEQRLHDAVRRWRRGYDESSLLVVEDTPDALTIRDRRMGWPPADHRLAGWHAAAYRLAERGRGVEALARGLAEQGHVVADAEVRSWLAQALAGGLLFRDGAQYVGIATRAVPTRVRPDGTVVPAPDRRVAALEPA
jgi:ribosomal peptide maturation radical SAM protein 1